MDYGEVLSKSWKILWKFKVLWIFGILAGCGTSHGGNFNFNSNFRTNGNGFSSPTPNLPPALLDPLYRFARLFENPTFIWEFVGIVVAVVCIIVIVEIFIGTMGRIGLIEGSAEADKGAEKLTFGRLWKESLPYFWRVFWLSLLLGTPFVFAIIAMVAGVLVILIPMGTPASISNSYANLPFVLLLLAMFCVFFCVILILSIIVGLISVQAERAIVLEDKSILDGFRRGWEVLTKNLGPILIIWLITVVIGIVVAIVITLPLIIVLVPLIFAFIANMNSVSFSLTPWLVVFACIICIYAPISWFLNGLVMAYVQAVWTLTYIRITAPKQEEQTPVPLPDNA